MYIYMYGLYIGCTKVSHRVYKCTEAVYIHTLQLDEMILPCISMAGRE